MVIYKIKNIINSHEYIGSAKNPKSRWANHLWQLRNNKHHSFKLQNAYNKYGEDKFSFEIIKDGIETNESLLMAEQYFIDNYFPYYNICKIAGNTNGIKASKEAREKMSAAGRGRPKSELWKKRASERFLGSKNPMYGTKKTREEKDIISKKIKDKYISGELTPNMGMLGKKQSEYQKEIVSKIHKGKVLSQETKDKISLYQSKNKKKVFVPELNKTFSSIKECYTFINTDKRGLQRAIKFNKKIKGFSFIVGES